MLRKPQVGPVSVSSSRIMASGFLCLFLSGLLLPSVFVSGQSSTEISATSSATASVTGSDASTTSMTQLSTMEKNSQISSSTMSMATKDTSSSQSTTMTYGGSTGNPTQSTMSTTYGGTAVSTANPSPTNTLSSVSQSKLSVSTEGTTSIITHSASPTSGGSSQSSTHSPPTTSRGSTLHSTLSVSSTMQDGMTVMNQNTSSNSSMDMISCPSFSCIYSDCYSMYNSQNASACASGESCQLLRSMNMWYNASCSASCAESCTNTTQTNCAVNCCNSTGCLSANFVSMMMTTTAAPTTTRAPTTTTTTSTTANNGNKCHKGECTGEDCYKAFKSEMLETCSSMQPHCQLKKESLASKVVWTAGCSNCTGYAVCRGSTAPPCNLECCTATKTSCLMLNGELNVPSFAARGPHLHKNLIGSLLFLLVLTLLL